MPRRSLRKEVSNRGTKLSGRVMPPCGRGALARCGGDRAPGQGGGLRISDRWLPGSGATAGSLNRLRPSGSRVARLAAWSRSRPSRRRRQYRREVLGPAVDLSEAEPFWTAFLRRPTRRGPRGVRLVI